MYVTIRKYRNMRSVAQAARRAESELVPILKRLPGFKSYYIIDCGGGIAASISIFDRREGAMASNERAIAWVLENLPNRHGGQAPEVTTGEVLVAVIG
jgi:hypothetical protein